MDTLPEQRPQLTEKKAPTQRFDALADELGATYPLLAPAALAAVGNEEDAFDEQILAGLVNV
jgi:hypothetical protein